MPFSAIANPDHKNDVALIIPSVLAAANNQLSPRMRHSTNDIAAMAAEIFMQVNDCVSRNDADELVQEAYVANTLAIDVTLSDLEQNYYHLHAAAYNAVNDCLGVSITDEREAENEIQRALRAERASLEVSPVTVNTPMGRYTGAPGALKRTTLTAGLAATVAAGALSGVGGYLVGHDGVEATPKPEPQSEPIYFELATPLTMIWPEPDYNNMDSVYRAVHERLEGIDFLRAAGDAKGANKLFMDALYVMQTGLEGKFHSFTPPTPTGEVKIGVGCKTGSDRFVDEWNKAFPDQELLAITQVGDKPERPLTEQEIRHLFEVQMEARITELKQSLSNDDISYANLLPHQQAALASLLFNGGAKLVGDNIRDGLRAGDDNAVIGNIRYRSNANGLEGLEVRRDVEATLFSGAPSLSPLAQVNPGAENWAKVVFSAPAQGR